MRQASPFGAKSEDYGLRAVLPDNEAARTRALELATNLGKAHLADLTTKAIQVTNDEGAVLFRVPIRRSTT
jgi:hypothetical protein